MALAIGPVLIQDGDFYGPVVNLASRLVGVANPGTVLASEEFRSALLAEAEAAAETGGGSDGGGAGGSSCAPFAPETSRTSAESRRGSCPVPVPIPGTDRRRNMRWERLEGVLRELDDLRDRGEQVVHRVPRQRPRPRSTAAATQSPSSRTVAIPWDRSSKLPSNGADGTPA